MTEPPAASQSAHAPPDSDEFATGNAPPYRAPLPGPAPLPSAGDSVDDFELLRELGAGSFGRVYLARQRSLGRLVALKVSARRGDEARTLARLEHSHIVQVFSEIVDPLRGFRLLCMQYVPGTTLAGVVKALAGRPADRRDGRAILEVLDSLDDEPVALDPAGLRERRLLAGCDAVEAVCWLGARLAEALAHAHGLGVLHRDVKPANVLLNHYGRPFLADFNVAARADVEAPLGGTLAYMAPEHLDAFAGDGPASAVGERADLYSLGLVLYELLAGGLPPSAVTRTGEPHDVVRALAAERRAGPPALPAGVPGPLASVVARCLDPDPDRRYASAADLARALEGCRLLRHASRSFPPPGPLTRALLRRPFALGCLLVLLPHLLGSIVNVCYNGLQIVGRLTPAQQSAFLRLVLVYNAVVYPLCVVALVALLLRVRRVWRRLSGPDPPSAPAVDTARRQALGLPIWCVFLSCLGWLPGGVLFPLLLGDVSGGVSRHFLISFTIAGLIALTYSYFAMQYVALRVLYPSLWVDPRQAAGARDELRGSKRRLAVFQFLAVLIPLAGAGLLIGTGAEDFDAAGYRTFRVLVTALIVLGMTGLGVAVTVSRRLHETLAALTRTDAGPR